jgi:hypothetical protein
VSRSAQRARTRARRRRLTRENVYQLDRLARQDRELNAALLWLLLAIGLLVAFFVGKAWLGTP